MTTHERQWGGIFLAAVGVISLLLEIALHIWTAVRHVLGIPGDVYELNHAVLIIGIIVGFVGFYILKPKEAEGGADIITRSVVSIVGVIRTGRRTGDVIPVVAPVTQPVTPTKRDDESAGG